LAQIEHVWRLSLSLSAGKQGETKKAEPDWLLPCFRPRVGARVALQRCPILRTSFESLPYPPTPFSLGDISTLQIRGHFYFALTANFEIVLVQSSKVPFVQS